jgi:hypothetical protein
MIYVGVGTDELILHTSVTGTIMLAPITFVYRLEITPCTEGVPVCLELSRSDGTRVAKLEGALPVEKVAGTRLNLSFAFNRLNLPGAGEYGWQLQVDDEKHEGTIRFRLQPQTAALPAKSDIHNNA